MSAYLSYITFILFIYLSNLNAVHFTHKVSVPETMQTPHLVCDCDMLLYLRAPYYNCNLQKEIDFKPFLCTLLHNAGQTNAS